jgi:Mor family transcriptional regulator
MNGNCDIIKRFIEILAEAQPGIGEITTCRIEQRLRHEFAGERFYIPKRVESLNVIIEERFTGNNTDKIARELHISRRTVYRALKKRRVAAR